MIAALVAQGRARTEGEAPASTARQGKEIQVLDPAKRATTARAAATSRPRSPRSWRSRSPAEKFAQLRASARIRRRSSCGRSSATCSTTAPSTSPASPTMRATSTSRSAGASAGRSARSRRGRPPVGASVAGWIVEDIAAGKTLASAPLPAWVGGPKVVAAKGVHTASGAYSAAADALRAALDAAGLPAPAVPGSGAGRTLRFRHDGVRDRRGADVAPRATTSPSCRSRPSSTRSATTCSTACCAPSTKRKRNSRAW